MDRKQAEQPATPKATLWNSKIAYGWEGYLDKDGAPDFVAKTFDKVKGEERRIPLDANETGDFLDLLNRPHACDAHFWPGYAIDDEGQPEDAIPRINKAALPVLRKLGGDLRFEIVVYDADDPTAHADRSGATAASASWRDAFVDLYAGLPAQWQNGGGYYFTKRGARLLWTLPKPLGPEEYIRFLRLFRLELAKHGIQTDDLKDWTRCYRLPDVVREGKRQQLKGDWSWLGDEPLLWLPPAGAALPDDDKSPARETTKREEFDPKRPFAGITETRTPLQLSERITENRNVTMTSLAGRLRRDGLQYEELLLALTGMNERRCEPPLDAAEVEKICRSICRYDAGVPEPEPALATQATASASPPIPPPPTAKPRPKTADGCKFALGSEREFADVMCSELEGEGGEKLRFDRGRMWKYQSDTGLWTVLPEPILRQKVTTYDGEWIHKGVDKKTGDDKFDILRVSKRMTDDVAKLTGILRYADGYFDDKADGLTFKNGFVHVDAQGVHLRPFDAQQRSTTAIAVDYKPGALPARFLRFLADVFEPLQDRAEVVQLIREYLGLCLVGKATPFAKVLIFVGEGANGKSTLLDIMSALFPDAALTSLPPQEMSNEYSRAMLVHSRLNVVNELPETDIMESEAFKAIADGRRIKAREIRQAPFFFRPQGGHVFAANALPVVRDMTHGFWRRIVIVPFERSFAEHEQDRELAGKIVAAELGQIASWVLEGAAAVLARSKFDVPASCAGALDTWRGDVDVVQQFVDEKCEPTDPKGPDALQPTMLYNMFRSWADLNGHRVMNSNRFARRVTKLGVDRSRISKARHCGLKAKPVMTAR